MTFSKHHHPLDPLDEKEITQAVSIVRKARDDTTQYLFSSVSLYEPPKEKVLCYLSQKTEFIDRQAQVILVDRPSGQIHDLVVSLTEETVKRWEKPSEGQPTFQAMEMIEAEKVILKDARVIEECAKLGFKDMSLIFVDTWNVGFHPESHKRRLMQGVMYARTSMDDNQYAHPLDIFPIYDVNTQQVIEIGYGVPKGSKYERPTIPLTNRQYLPEQLGKENLRHDLKPIDITQPEGVSFKITNDREIAWQKWKLLIGFNFREGLVLHDVRYQDGDNDRPLFYRISLSEMVVPYGNPYHPYNKKFAFDAGFFGIGNCTNSLKGCDCSGTIYYLDATLCDVHGKPYTVPNAICIHEEDYGILQKHTEYRSGKTYSIRARRLVISQIITAANYDYGFYFYLYQDGSIQYEVKATGELNTCVLAEDEDPRPYGTTVAPQIVGQYHQHFFCMRIDPMIDGEQNSVAQVDFIPSEHPTGHPDNPAGNAFYPVTTIFKSTDQAKTDADATKGRTWKIINESKIHPYTKEPMGFKLASYNTPPLLPKPDSVVARCAAFATKTLWVTPYKDHQIYPAGFYCNQDRLSLGLPVWTKENLPIQNKDVVLYFTFGLTHAVRVEDFPIMPVETCGFVLKPDGFFLANPALDVPPLVSSKTVRINITTMDDQQLCC
ncbi:copper amine oxidase [Halteromyces radiatus]|uniref:copper amine oxidase n=1 Tax=Halteromyces radiatus TaxID=101107 RepID=UPI00221FF51B|nr:copper amine oxidase [Halteromyces radiatus]KAI8097629.1 copper amine oxidase [Halteromyces radiatus]